VPPDPIGLALVHALDAVAFAQDRLNFDPDPWQAKLLRSQETQIILNCSRQSGKSTCTSILALHTAIYNAGALILLISPSLRQSKELFNKVIVFLRTLEPAEVLEEDNKSSCTLANGSRIVSLPSDEKTIRGYSGPKLIVEDEASRVHDDVHAALRPMLAVGGGRLVLMSTPAGKRGHFYDAWHSSGDGWEKIRLLASECPRISPAFLDEERRTLGTLVYQQEYECQFTDTSTSAFMSELIERAFTNDLQPFLAN
jgi:phage FluMu gp28-like protein